MIVFTNGCFDILHRGHIYLLDQAKNQGTRLIVGINSDNSVRRIKGAGRPVNSQEDRKEVLLALRSVDEVLIFDELTPELLIEEIKPDILVKGGDWKESEIIGADFVRSSGGKVVSIPLVDGYSTSKIIEGTSSHNPTDLDREPGRSASYVKTQLSDFAAIVGKELVSSIEECGTAISTAHSGGMSVLVFGAMDSLSFAGFLTSELRRNIKNGHRDSIRNLTASEIDSDSSGVKPGDVFLALSPNAADDGILAAAMWARTKGCKVLGLTATNGRKLAALCDECVMVPSDDLPLIQHIYLSAAHDWGDLLRKNLDHE